MHLERWWVENSFKRIKGKFNLERIRVIKHKVFFEHNSSKPLYNANIYNYLSENTAEE